MPLWRISPQQLDPLGGVTAQVFGWGIAVASLLVAVLLTAFHLEEYNNPLLLLASLLAITLACLVVVLGSAPVRSPFGRRTAVLLHLLGLAAVVLEAAAQWGTNLQVRSDWAPVSFAVLILITGCFRPAFEILTMTIASSFVIATVTALGASAAGWVFPGLIYSAITAGPFLALGVGAAVFSSVLVRRLLAWREATRGQRVAATDRMRARVRDTLQADRLALIEAEVGPLLREVQQSAEITSEQIEQAALLGAALRRSLVQEAQEGWLDGLVVSIDDPQGLASRMDETQRAAIDAACAALAGRQIQAVIRPAVHGAVRLTLSWERGGGGRLGPELQAMLRHVFPGARVRPSARWVEVEFSPA